MAPGAFQLSRGGYPSCMKDGFDWVRARAGRNLRELFGDLRALVEANVRSACIHVAPDIALQEPVPGCFLVRVPFPNRPDLEALSRRFHVCDEDSSIRVFGSGPAPLFVARVHLGGADSVLEVDKPGAYLACPMRLGEFSRVVLEPVFFRGR